MDWKITGHKKQLEFLENALQRGKLAHAYVFAGPEGVGKKTIALKLAHELLNVQTPHPASSPRLRRVEAGGHPLPEGEGQSEENHSHFHPDLLEVNSDNGIKIEQIRELIYKLSLKPYQGQNKVAIIDRADEMNIESANALLKSLEEPKPYTYIILITSNPQRLPKTILSRCQKITFGPVEGITEGQREDKEKAEEFYKIFISENLVNKLIMAYEIADLETVQIKSLLDSWLGRMQSELHQKATTELAKKISQVSVSRRFLEQNVNSKLLLTNLMLNT